MADFFCAAISSRIIISKRDYTLDKKNAMEYVRAIAIVHWMRITKRRKMNETNW